MNRTRRALILGLGAGVAGGLSGCLTKKLFEEDRYTELVSSVLISKDERTLAFIGKDHHYVFDAPAVLVRTLKEPFHRAVSGDFGTFHVEADGTTRGSFALRITSDASDSDRASAESAGYQKSGSSLGIRGELGGKRYSAGSVSIPTPPEELNRTYSVAVIAEQSSLEKTGHVLLTPFTVTADGIILIAAMPFALIGVGALAALCPRHSCH